MTRETYKERRKRLPSSYTLIEMEAALCAWEFMLECRIKHDNDPDSLGPNMRNMMEQWEGHGFAAMRHCSMQAGMIAARTYELMEAQGIEFEAAYDWEFVPSVLCRLDWVALCADNQYAGTPYRPNISAILRDMMKDNTDFTIPPTTRERWVSATRSAADEMWCYADLLSDHEDRIDDAIREGITPQDFARQLGEELDLISRAQWKGF